MTGPPTRMSERLVDDVDFDAGDVDEDDDVEDDIPSVKGTNVYEVIIKLTFTWRPLILYRQNQRWLPY